MGFFADTWIDEAARRGWLIPSLQTCMQLPMKLESLWSMLSKSERLSNACSIGVLIIFFMAGALSLVEAVYFVTGALCTHGCPERQKIASDIVLSKKNKKKFSVFFKAS